MKPRPAIAACVLASAACLTPQARSAELVTLRNGFTMRCDHHIAAGGSIRLYLTAGNDDYMELPPSQIASVSPLARMALPPPNPALQATGLSSHITVAESTRPLASEAAPRFALASGRSSAPPPPALTPADLRQMLARAGRAHNLDVDLLASVIHAESGGNPRAVSRAGARGLMQLMPATAASLGVRNSFQPQQNVGGGSAYLDLLLTRYSDNLALALAAYNAGPQAVDRYRGIPPYSETQAYVARVIHEFNRRVLARRVFTRRAAAQALPHKLQADVSQK